MLGREEKRLFERVKKEIPIKLIFPHQEVKATVVDLSGEGAGIFSSNPLPDSRQVEMVFLISEKKQGIHLKGEMVWRKEVGKQHCRAGIRIINPSLLTISKIYYHPPIRIHKDSMQNPN